MKNHYDVCMAGFWYGSNYGSLLNGYAEYRLLKSFNKEVLMLQKPNAPENDPEITQGHNKKFIDKYYDSNDISPSLSYDQLSELNNICDCFCAGSDQIWNYNLSFHENLYLPFVNSDKKLISFATSFGHKNDKTPSNCQMRIGSYLQRYNAISVREQFDVDILKNNYNLKSTLVFEPVFCIDRKIYEELAESSSFDETEPYLLTYILDASPEKREAILYYSEKLNIKVINILEGNANRWEINKNILNLPNILSDVGTEDFIKAFMNASYVITDSFHGSAFSIIFNKPFFAIGNYGRGYERFVDLLTRLKLSERLISDPKNIPYDIKYLAPIDYNETNKIIQSEAKRTIEWFRYAVETPKEKLNQTKIPDNITVKLDKDKCMGCGACVSICPADALSLNSDKSGYYRSEVKDEKCVECGKCIKICPALKLPEKINNKSPELYEFIADDENILFNSSSGGAFSLLAKETFKKNGIIFGASWNEDLSVRHIMIDNEKDLYKLQKSKYLQSYMGDTFRKVKENLEKDIFVLFSGCPCQVSGLKSYLGKDYDNLIIVDLLCSYAPSQMFFKKYLEDDFSEKPVKYEFRNKKSGWNCTTIKAEFSDNSSVLRNGEKQDNYQRVYHNHRMCSPHCENCKYQSLPRYGDITIGDFWGIEKKDKSIDCSKGVSAVLCNNEKGKKFFEGIPESSCRIRKEVPLEWLGGNGYAVRGHNFCSPYRNNFYKAIETMPFSKAVNYAVKPNHGNYPKPEEFLYSAENSHFKFSSTDWEERYINGATMLFAKKNQSEIGKFAVISLPYSLKKGKKYIFSVRFKVSTDSKYLNFNLKSSGEKILQVAYHHKVSVENNLHWVEVSKEFVPDFDCYDEIAIGASQVTGDNRWLAIDYIKII